MIQDAHGAFDCRMCLEVKIPAFGHGDAPVDQGAVERVTQLAMLCIRVAAIGRIESSVVALADDDDGYLGWWPRGFLAIGLLTLCLERFQLEI